MSTISYCVNGCGQGKRTTEPPSRICQQCEKSLNHWLTTIPDNYALLPQFVEHGSTDRNPDSKTTKSAYAPAPMRLEIVDLLDARLGRKWLGTAAADDRRGVIGTLKSHADRLRDERHLTAPHDELDINAACALLRRHRLWLAEQDWITDLYTDIKQINRELSDAVGDYRRPPVGRCHIDTENGTTCRGGLYANPYGGVRCSRCGATWDAAHLRQLGLAQAAAQEPSR